MRVLYLLLLSLITLPVIADADILFANNSFITPDNPLLQYTGRVDVADATGPVLSWSGSSVKVKFNGQSVKVVLDDNGSGSFHIVIDANEDSAFTLRCSKGKAVYTIASNLKAGEHELLIYKRTEFGVGCTKFLGFILDKDKNLLPLPPKPSKKIEFYGDSITCGMGNEDLSFEHNDDMSLENHYMTYGAITVKNLNAEGVYICQSGIGFMKSWFDGVMGDIYDRLNPADTKSKWDFSKWQPDVVVINLGTNDSWLVSKMDPVPTGDEIIKAYADFVRKLRCHYPDAYIICALGNMTPSADGSLFSEYIVSAVEILKNTDGEKKIDWIIFPQKKTPAHPTISEHQVMSIQLTEKIKSCLNW